MKKESQVFIRWDYDVNNGGNCVFRWNFSTSNFADSVPRIKEIIKLPLPTGKRYTETVDFQVISLHWQPSDSIVYITVSLEDIKTFQDLPIETISILESEWKTWRSLLLSQQRSARAHTQ